MHQGRGWAPRRRRSATDDVVGAVIRLSRAPGEGRFRGSGRCVNNRPMSRSRSRYDGPLRVLVVDADDRVRESLTGLLAIGGRCVVVAGTGYAGPAFDLA